MERHSERLGAAITERRLSLGMDHKRFAAACGISETSLRALESGTGENPQTGKLFGVDAAARAPMGSCERILSGTIEDFPPLPTQDDLELAGRIAALDDGDNGLLRQLVKRLNA
jgi:transcriptional regulator with XRE-family HTH domain